MNAVKNMKRLSGLVSRLTITFLSLALISGVARGAVFTVNTPADTNNPGACISPGPCSFREAINASNKSKLVRDSIVFDPAVFQYPGDIFNSGGTTVQLSSELPAIINSVDIDGGSTTISGWLDPRYYPISDNGLGGHIPYVDEDGNPRLDGSGNIRYRYNYDYSSSSNLSDSTGGCTLHPTLRVLGPRYSGVAHSNADGTTIKHLIFYDGVFGGSSAAVRPCANVLIQGAKNVEISASSFIATAFNFQPGIGIFERGGLWHKCF